MKGAGSFRDLGGFGADRLGRKYPVDMQTRAEVLGKIMSTDLQKTNTWLDKKLERRTLLKKVAIGGASLAVLYVAPNFTSVNSAQAFEAITGVDRGGCTPGFWKTDTPSTDWTPTGYAPDVEYDDKFIVPIAYAGTLGGGKTLLSVLSQGGGCEKALGRHSAAALLNAALGTIGKTEAEVIAETNAALATENCTTISTLKNTFDGLNNGGCLDGARIPEDPAIVPPGGF